MRRYGCRRRDRALDFFASWIGHKSAESIPGHSAGPLSLQSDEGIVTLIFLAVALRVAAVDRVLVNRNVPRPALANHATHSLDSG